MIRKLINLCGHAIFSQFNSIQHLYDSDRERANRLYSLVFHRFFAYTIPRHKNGQYFQTFILVYSNQQPQTHRTRYF